MHDKILLNSFNETLFRVHNFLNMSRQKIPHKKIIIIDYLVIVVVGAGILWKTPRTAEAHSPTGFLTLWSIFPGEGELSTILHRYNRGQNLSTWG
jgi:hypothetical protein